MVDGEVEPLQEKKHPSWRQITIGTLAGINLMMLALIAGKESIAIEESVPSLAKTPEHTAERVEYGMEWVKTTTVPAYDPPAMSKGAGHWVVEQYREMEYHYDMNGRLLFKRPTNQSSYMRYFKPQ